MERGGTRNIVPRSGWQAATERAPLTAGQQRGDIRPPDVLRDFSFTRPQRRMNWQLLGGVDIDDIARRGDVRPVLAALDDVAGCSVYGDEVEADPALRHVFSMAQLSVQYLMHTTQVLEDHHVVLADKVRQAEVALQKAKADDAVMKARLRRMRKAKEHRDEQIASYAALLKSLDPELAERVVVAKDGSLTVQLPKAERERRERLKQERRERRRERRARQRQRARDAAQADAVSDSTSSDGRFSWEATGDESSETEEGEPENVKPQRTSKSKRRSRRHKTRRRRAAEEDSGGEGVPSALLSRSDMSGRSSPARSEDSAPWKHRSVPDTFAKPQLLVTGKRDAFGDVVEVDGKPPPLHPPGGRPPADAAVHPPPDEPPPPLAFDVTATTAAPVEASTAEGSRPAPRTVVTVAPRASGGRGEAGGAGESIMTAVVEKRLRGMFRRSIECHGGDRDSLRGVFSVMDKDGNGLLSSQELSRALDSLKINLDDEADRELLFRHLDSDGSGAVDYHEFIAWVFAGDGAAASGVGIGDSGRAVQPLMPHEVTTLHAGAGPTAEAAAATATSRDPSPSAGATPSHAAQEATGGANRRDGEGADGASGTAGDADASPGNGDSAEGGGGQGVGAADDGSSDDGAADDHAAAGDDLLVEEFDDDDFF